MRRTIVPPLVIGVTSLLAACGGETPPEEEPAAGADTARAAGPATIAEVFLADSVPWETAMAAGVDRRVAVRWDGAVDTLAGVAVTERPVVVGDTAVWGLHAEAGDPARGFRWSVGSQRVETFPLPDDLTPFLASGLSPGADRLAYVSKTDDGKLKAMVRSWPGNDLLYEGPPVSGYPSDATNSAVEWSGDEVEIRIRLHDLEPPGSWLRVRGTPAASMAIDTVPGGEAG